MYRRCGATVCGSGESCNGPQWTDPDSSMHPTEYIHVYMYESTLLVGRYVRFSLVPNSQRVANWYTEISTTLNDRTKTGKMRTALYIFEAEDELRITFEFLYLFL